MQIWSIAAHSYLQNTGAMGRSLPYDIPSQNLGNTIFLSDDTTYFENKVKNAAMINIEATKLGFLHNVAHKCYRNVQIRPLQNKTA